MATLREIKKRIVNVANVQRITQSLKAVATSRLANIKSMATNNANFFTASEMGFTNLFWLHKQQGDESNKLYNFIFNKNASSLTNPMVICFTSNRGLCGAYNSNVIGKLNNILNNLQSNKQNFKIISFGEKGFSFLNKHFKTNLLPFNYSSDLKDVTHDDFMLAALNIVDLVKGGQVDDINIIYTFSKSVLSQEVRTESLFPIQFDVKSQDDFIQNNLVTEEENFTGNLEQLCVNYIAYKLYNYFINSLIAEFSSRLTAMDNAYENCKDLNEKLSLSYNRTRQGMVTKELSEIVAGAEAS